MSELENPAVARLTEGAQPPTDPVSVSVPTTTPRTERFGVTREALAMRRTKFGVILAGAVTAIAVFGPLVAPHGETELVGAPYAVPSGSSVLGLDALGRDVLSRVLHGGFTILVLSYAATVIGVTLGAAFGLAAGYVRGVWDEMIMRSADVLLCFPPVVFGLLLMSVLGPKDWLVVVAVALIHVPQTARVMRGAAVQLTGRDFISYAEALGIRPARILLRELLPNVGAPLTVEFGIRTTFSIAVIASLSFLGFGAQPPVADWGLMINENRGGLTIQPWPVAVPVLLLALVTIGNNMITDGFGRALSGIDRTIDTEPDE